MLDALPNRSRYVLLCIRHKALRVEILDTLSNRSRDISLPMRHLRRAMCRDFPILESRSHAGTGKANCNVHQNGCRSSRSNVGGRAVWIDSDSHLYMCPMDFRATSNGRRSSSTDQRTSIDSRGDQPSPDMKVFANLSLLCFYNDMGIVAS